MSYSKINLSDRLLSAKSPNTFEVPNVVSALVLLCTLGILVHVSVKYSWQQHTFSGTGKVLINGQHINMLWRS